MCFMDEVCAFRYPERQDCNYCPYKNRCDVMKLKKKLFTKEQLNTASQEAYKADFKDLDKANQRWIIEKLQRE